MRPGPVPPLPPVVVETWPKHAEVLQAGRGLEFAASPGSYEEEGLFQGQELL